MLGFPTRSYYVLCFVYISTSLFRRIQFHLENIHLQFSKQLCAPSGSRDSTDSQQKWPWTTAFQIHCCFRSLVPSRLLQASRWQKEPQCALDAILSLKLSATSEFLFPTCLAVFHVYSFLLLSDDSLFRPLQMVTAAMKLKDAYSLEGKL